MKKLSIVPPFAVERESELPLFSLDGLLPKQYPLHGIDRSPELFKDERNEL